MRSDEPEACAVVRGRGETGVVGAEVLPFAVLVFVVGTLVFAQAWAALDAKLAAIAGAEQAVRTYVEHSARSTALAADAAVAAGGEAIAGYRNGAAAGISPIGQPRLVRCHRVTFEATQHVPQLAAGWLGRSPTFMRSRASEIVDPFRDGLPGQAPCSLPR